MSRGRAWSRSSAYLFADGIAERLHGGQRREAVLCAWGITTEGQKVLLHLSPGAKEDTESRRAFFQDLKRRGLCDSCTAPQGCEEGPGPRQEGGLPMTLQLSIEGAALLRGILLDFAETFDDCEEEADRVAVATRVAEAIGEALL